MMQISVTIEAMFGLNWSTWQDFIRRVECAGYAGLYRSDHFMVGKPGIDSLELITSLTYLASHSQKLHFGSLVAPFSFHHPATLARQAMAINDLSGGRLVLGVGSGWYEDEHSMYGFHLGDKKTRLDRLEEGLSILHALVHSPEPVSFAGRFYHLREAELAPRSPVRILVGGNGRTRTLPLAARYADVWNCQLADPAAFAETNRYLDGLIAAAGRRPEDVRRSVLVPVLVTRTRADLDRHVALIQEHVPAFRQSSAAEIKAWLYGLKGIIGSPQQVVDGLAAYAQSGAHEMILEWFGLFDLEGFDLLATEILPHFR